MSYGSWGVGSAGHLSSAHLSKSQNAEMSHVAYKGEAPMITDLIGGQIQMAFASAQQAKSFIDTGKLKAIGVTGEQRISVLPNVPTLVEQGLKDDVFRVTGWVAMAAPAATPQAVVQRLADEVRTACELPDVRAHHRPGLHPRGPRARGAARRLQEGSAGMGAAGQAIRRHAGLNRLECAKLLSERHTRPAADPRAPRPRRVRRDWSLTLAAPRICGLT